MFTDEIASLAKSTRVRTNVVLKDLIKVAGSKLIVSSLKRGHVDKTVAAWRARNLAESSINNYKASLRQFGEYLYESRLNRENPAKHLKTVKTVVNYDKRRPLTPEQARKVVMAADYFHERDKVTVQIALYTALRASELTSLRWMDVDFEAGVIRAYRSKLTDIHVVPMGDELIGILTAWKGSYELRTGPIQGDWYVVPALLNSVALFRVPSYALKLSPKAKQTNFRQRLKKYMRIAGVPNAEILGVHALRRTSGNLLLDSGADVRDVQYLYGHSSERQTQHYLDRDVARDKLADRVKGWKI